MADAFIGEIRLFCGNFAPTDWAFCNGQLLNISAYSPLFSLIGTTFGGNGTSDFGLPNLQGRVALGYGQGNGLSNNYQLGESGGAYTVALTEGNLPAHTHTLNVSGTTATSLSPSGNVFAALPSSYVGYADQTISGLTTGALNSGAVSSTGEGLNHDNSMPSLTVSFIICLNGIYPSFNKS